MLYEVITVVIAANVHDSQVLDDLLHGNETRARGNSAYARQQAAMKEAALRARDFTQYKGSRIEP